MASAKFVARNRRITPMKTKRVPEPPPRCKVPLSKITSILNHLKQARPDLITRLADSMKRCGLIEAIVARPTRGGNFQLVAGRHRFWAAQKLGWESIDAVIRKMNRAQAELVMIDSDLCVAQLSSAQLS
jgi:hypothetical protein